ncbi:molybdenum cofactor guanylyltransferase [Reyranella sp.]|jgi:molybdopterin-guanine dinucleotide biosynthesis protein A|uniref:molybdenum cofactor guanylyltransferase n=1 Tax=Reyranella sp. TaxID=1929291 RepID=UPI002F92CE75
MAVNALQDLGPVRAAALVGVVLAGGEGRRMGPGAPKPLRRLAGKPMLAHVVERLAPQVMDLVVVANDPAPELRTLNVSVIPDPPEVRRLARQEGRPLGPLAGILAGMEWSREHHPHVGWILSAPADVPLLPLDLTVRLCGHMHVPEPEVLMVRHGRRREHALGVWSVTLVADLRRAVLKEGIRRAEDFARRHDFAELAWPDDDRSFLNVNTPEDLRLAERQVALDRQRRARSRSRR